MRKPRIVAVAFGVTAVVTLAVAPAIVGWTILVESFVLGLTFAWRKVPVDTLVQEAVPDRFRGRVFAVYDLTYASARVVAAAVAVPLIPHLSPGWLLAVVGVAYLGCAPLVPRWVRRHRRAAVRFVAGGRADETPRAVVIGGDEEPVRLLRSTLEETAGGPPTRRLVVETGDGTVIELLETRGSDRWDVVEERP
jgi:MFS family permease